DRGIVVADVVSRTLRVKELEKEVIRIRDVSVPAVKEYRKFPFLHLTCERGPIREVVDFGSHSHSSKVSDDALVLPDDAVVLDARPDCQRRQAPAVRIAGLDEQLPGPRRIELVPLHLRVEAHRAGRKDSSGQRVPPEKVLFDDSLAIDGEDQRLAYAPVIEW